MSLAKQQFITSFFKKKPEDELNRVSKVAEMWEPLFYDRERVDSILNHLEYVKRDCEESYRRSNIKVSKEKINKVFDILNHEDAKRLMGLFRRTVPICRKYYKITRLENKIKIY